jgi:tRNA pseudouridine38-40 synthase
MPSFRITVAYDGTDYVGWQRQANGVSIQGLIEDALEKLDGRAVAVAGAGRTDSGVHALGQVAGFTLGRAMAADVLVRALNAHLPDAIRVIAADEVPATFHPRFAAHSKTYRYRILNGEVANPFERRYTWHVPGALDLVAMRAAARLLVGQHDFAAFQASGSDVASTTREILSSWIVAESAAADAGSLLPHPRSDLLPLQATPDPILAYEITGSGFLRHMVRTIVGTLVEIGRGRRPVDSMAQLLILGDRASAGPTAPASGLFLVGVDYGPVCS